MKMNKETLFVLSLIMASADGDSWLSILWSVAWIIVAISIVRKESYD